MSIPMMLYSNDILGPSKAGNNKSEDSLTSGELIRKVKVTPSGIPAERKPMNKGIEEQEQKGVIAPSIAARRYSKPYHLLELRIFFTFSTGK